MTRLGYGLVTALACPLVAILACFDPAPRFVWNASASVPIGLYVVSPGTLPAIGEMALVMPSPVLANWLARRHYLPLGVPLIKHVAAATGQNVCRSGVTIMIDDIIVAQARTRDQAGRSLPTWSGCRKLGRGEIMLLNASVEDSLDGRYFGPTPVNDLIGTVRPMLTRAGPQAPFAWHGGRP